MHIFDFARNNCVELERWEKLTLWFHDLVYSPLKKDNERESVSFMCFLLNDHAHLIDDLEKAKYGIYSTKYHDDINIIKKYHKILDLDICHFARKKDFKLACAKIEKEYLQSMDASTFWSGRKVFMENLLDRKYIFRTPSFQKRFDQQARNNIKQHIKELTKKLKSLGFQQ